MHEECVILRFEIMVFSVMGPSNLNGQHKRFGLDLLLPSLMACVNRPKMLHQNIHNHGCTSLYGGLTQITLWILTTVSTSNPIPKIIKNWYVDGNVTLGKLNDKRVCVCCDILCLKERGNKPFSILLHILWSELRVEFQTSTTIIPQGNFISDCDIKQHITMKR
jgi:hypothetical protein